MSQLVQPRGRARPVLGIACRDKAAGARQELSPSSGAALE